MRRGNEKNCWSRGGWAGTTAVTAILAVGLAATQALGADSSKPITIGYSTYTVSNPAFAGIIQGMKEEAEKFGYKFIVANSNNSADAADRGRRQPDHSRRQLYHHHSGRRRRDRAGGRQRQQPRHTGHSGR